MDFLLGKTPTTGCNPFTVRSLVAWQARVFRSTARFRLKQNACSRFQMSCKFFDYELNKANPELPSQHRVSPFELADPTKPGHRRFIALWLVDPHKRIISTANVPPQQLSWWAESLVGKDIAASEPNHKTTNLTPEIVRLLQENDAQIPVSSVEGKLPEEVLAMIQEHVPKEALPMSLEEAKEYRLKLMEERGIHQERAEDSWQRHTYGFCEH